MLFLIVAVIAFVGIVTQTVIGFGVALVSMPLLVQVLDPASAAAYLAILTVPMQVIIIWRYRHALNIRPIWRVIIGTAIGSPIGVFLVAQLDRRILLGALGVFLIVYALYSLLNPRLPEIRPRKWDLGFGIASGVLGGAYNTAGPPLVIYGTSLGWKPQQFKANLQALFMLSNFIVIISHLVAGHVDTHVLENVLVSLPVLVIGTTVGFWLSRTVKEATFRKVVLVVLIVIGVRLLLP